MVRYSIGRTLGPLLDPLFFVIFIGDLPEVVMPGNFVCHYMLTTAKHPGLHFVFQSDLDNLYAWSQQNLMEFIVTKCKLMHITKRKTPIHSDLHLNNRDLKQ